MEMEVKKKGSFETGEDIVVDISVGNAVVDNGNRI